jgi:hypothetical protein
MSEKRIFVGNHTKMTYGKEYSIVDFKHGTVNVVDDYGNRMICLDSYFVSLDDWRLIQIDKYIKKFDNSKNVGLE